MLARVMKTDRQRWFADHLRALRSWPERSREENLEAAARVNPQRLMNTGGLAEVALSIELEALVSAPEDGIDVDELRKVLSELDNRQGDRFLKLLVERMPVPRGTPTGWDTRVLMKIRRAHKRMMASLASDPENHVLGSWLREIDLTEGAKVPIPHYYAEIRKKISG